MMVRGSWGFDLLILTVLLVLFFGFKLGERALWSPDEGRYSEVAREMVVSGDYVTPRLDGVKFFKKPPFFYWLETLSIRAFGLSETALRLWPALFALGGCLAVYAAARKLFGRRSGLIAAVVLATSGLHYAMSRVANLDMILSALIACALLSFLVGTREAPGPRRRLAMWTFYVFSALAVLEKGLIGIVIPALVIGTWVALLNDWKIIRTIYLPTGSVLFLAIAAPWHILVGWINPEFFQFYFVHEHFQRFLYGDGTFERPWSFMEFYAGTVDWLVSVDDVLGSGVALQPLQGLAPASRLSRGAISRPLGGLGIRVFLAFQFQSHSLHPADVPAPGNFARPLLLSIMDNAENGRVQSGMLAAASFDPVVVGPRAQGAATLLGAVLQLAQPRSACRRNHYTVDRFEALSRPRAHETLLDCPMVDLVLRCIGNFVS